MANAISVVDDSSVSLFAPRDSTSLWVSEAGERRVAALDEVDFTPAKYEDAPGVLASSLDNKKPRDWAVNILVVKRNGQYNVYVDGREATPVDGVVELRSHTGLWRHDESPSISVFSPCMVSFLVEDGESVPHECAVELWQRPTDLVGNAGSTRNLMGRKNLKPARASCEEVEDMFFESAVTMFPTTYRVPMTISFYDLGPIERMNLKETTGEILNFATLSAYGFAQLVAFGSMDITALLPLGLSALSIGLAYTGYILSNRLLRLFADRLSTGNKESLTSPNFINSVWGEIRQSIRRTAKVAKKVTFTIDEFSSVLENLAVLSSVSDDKLDELSGKTGNFSKEIVVFNWLLYSKEGKAPAERNPGSPNPPEFSDAQKMQGVSIELGVSILASCSKFETSFVSSNAQDRDPAAIASLAMGEIYLIEKMQASLYMFKDGLNESLFKSFEAESNVEDYEKYLTNGPGYPYYLNFRRFMKAVAKSTIGFRPTPEQIKEAEINNRKLIAYAIQQWHKKAFNAFLAYDAPPQTRLRQLKETLNKLVVPFKQTLLASTWTRYFPHTNKGRVVPFFPTINGVEDNFIERDADETPVTIFSYVSKSSKAFNSASSRASKFLSTRLDTLERACEMNLLQKGNIVQGSFGRVAVPRAAPSPLTIHQPFELSKETGQNLTEQLRNAVELVVSPNSNTGLLSALGILDSVENIGAINTFALFVIDELLNYHKNSQGYQNDVAIVLGGPIKSAISRAKRAGSLLEKMCASSNTGLVSAQTPLFQCNRMGRDVQRIISSYNTIRLGEFDSSILSNVPYVVSLAGSFVPALPAKGWSVDSVKAMKSAALSIKQIASKLNSIFLKPGVDPMNFVSKLPHETLHSLFQDRRDGLVAYERGVLFSERLPLSPLWKKWIKCAFSVAYASNAIVERNERAFLSDKNQPVNKLNYDEISNLKLRLARLRVPTQTLNSRISYVKSSNDLSETLANMFIDTKEFTVASFYVPYGYGDPLPNLRSPPVSNPMFGSVPVWLEDLRTSCRDLKGALDEKESKYAGCNIMLTWGECENNKNLNADTLNPYILQVHNDVDMDAMRISARGCFPIRPQLKINPSSTTTDIDCARTAVDAFDSTFDSSTIEILSMSVSSLAWNAERVLQCILIAYSHDKETFDFELNVPPDPDFKFSEIQFQGRKQSLLLEAWNLYDAMRSPTEFELALIEYAKERRMEDPSAPPNADELKQFVEELKNAFVEGFKAIPKYLGSSSTSMSTGATPYALLSERQFDQEVLGSDVYLKDDELLVRAKHAKDFVDKYLQGFWKYYKKDLFEKYAEYATLDEFVKTEEAKAVFEKLRRQAKRLQETYENLESDIDAARVKAFDSSNSRNGKTATTVFLESISAAMLGLTLAKKLLGEAAVPKFGRVIGLEKIPPAIIDAVNSTFGTELSDAIKSIQQEHKLTVYKLSEVCAITIASMYGR